MSDYTDAILDGDICEGCHEELGEGDGYRRLCPACEAERARREGEPA